MRLTDPSPIGQRNEALWGTDLVVAACLFLMVFGSGVVHIQSFPPLFFDEGWTVCVARTWVESGHYGCLLMGEPAPPSLAAAAKAVPRTVITLIGALHRTVANMLPA